MNKYQHIIDTLLQDNEMHTVSKLKSNWRYKVYPKPRIWVNMSTINHTKKFNKLIKKKNNENSNRKSTNVWTNNHMGQR